MKASTSPNPAAQKASFWKRLIAFVIDTLFIGIGTAIAGWFLKLPSPALNFIFSIVFYTYGTVFEYFFGYTLGKAALGLKVIGVHGQRLSWMNVFMRNFGKIISAIPLCYGFIRILAPHRLQTIHDELGRSLVIDLGKK